MGYEDETAPEFPLPAYRDMSQVVSLPLVDGQCAEDLVSNSVRIQPLGDPREKPSSMLKLKTEVDYSWEDRYYNGQIVAVHSACRVIAYTVSGASLARDGGVRIISLKTSNRILIKGPKGVVQDIAFASTDNEIILAIVDEEGSLFVHEITEDKSGLKHNLMLHVTHSVTSQKGCGHRVVWVHYIPEDPDGPPNNEDVINTKLLALLLGSKAEIWNVAMANEKYGVGPLRSEAVESGLLIIEDHTDIITDATFSFDGSAIATASLDGTIQFFQVYMHEQPKRLHNWTPHDGQPISSLFFLDDKKYGNEDCQFWKFVVTGGNDNREIRVWDCKDWKLLQTVVILKDEDRPCRLKAAMDQSAQFLLLSDQYSEVLYLFRVQVCKNDVYACLNSVSAYVVPFSILSYAIVDVATKLIKTNSFDLDDELDDDDLDPLEEVEIEKKVLPLYLVQPKSLQECQLQILEPQTDQLIYSALVPNVQEPPLPINLMTPIEFTTPIKTELDSSVLSVKNSDGNDLLVSGGSSPSREVCEILNVAEDEDEEIPAIFSVEESSEKADVPVVKNELPAATNDWPHIPAIPDAQMQEMTSRIRKRESLGVSATTVEVIDALPPKENHVEIPTVYSAEIQTKLDAIIIALQSQEASINDLRKKVIDKRDNSSMELLQRALEAHGAQLKEQLTRRDEQERDRQESLLYDISQAMENLIAVKLEETVPLEIRKNVLPAVLADLEPFKRNLHVEMTQQLSTTDHLLKENISKLVQSKSVMDVLALSLASVLRNNIAEMCKDLFATFVLPRMEKVMEKTFQQVHETFTVGTRECLGRMVEEVNKVKDEMKRCETCLRQSADFSKNATNHLQNEIHKSLLGVGDRMGKQLVDTIQREMLAGRALIGSTVASRAATPALQVQDKQTHISQLISAGHYNAAFQEALSASDLNLVIFACGQVKPSTLFQDKQCTLQQPVLLSLLQQLTADMSTLTEIKCSYLQDAILHLEMDDPTTKEHIPGVLSDIQRQINSYLVHYPKSEHRPVLTRVLRMMSIQARK